LARLGKSIEKIIEKFPGHEATDVEIAELAEAYAVQFAENLYRWAEETAPEGHYFDERAADRAVFFFKRYLRHTKGKWAGRPFDPLTWQAATLRVMFGWKRADGTRRFRIVYIEVPRKNGKTGFAAGVGLLMTFADHEVGAEVYSFASDTKQAALAHTEAKRMRSQSQELAMRSREFARAITLGPPSYSSYQVLSSSAGTKHGLNASCIIGDEVHTFAHRDLYDTLHTSTGARAQPLELLITTSGFDRLSFCYEQHEYAKQVRDGDLEDPEFLPIIFAADPDADISDPRVWAQANPSLGQTIGVDYVRKEAKKAGVVPSAENAFKRLHLSIWTEQATRWLPMVDWRLCATQVDEEALEGRDCFAGLDLSSRNDITALVLLFPPIETGEPWHVVARHFCPADGVAQRARKDRVPYDLWVREGHMIATEGNVVDYDVIRAVISGKQVFAQLAREPEGLSFVSQYIDAERPLAERFNIQEIAFDAWNSSQLVTQLMADGHEMVTFRQGYASMSPPCRELAERFLPGHLLAHGGNPVLTWMASNAVAWQDPAGNLKPDKSKSGDKIDGIVALIMALGRALVHQEDQSGSYLEDEELVVA